MSINADQLSSPADADHFRMTVDWGRWYIDPLPGCDIAPATEDRWPSCSAIKKAADKDWSFLTVNRIAALDPAELHRIADLDRTQRADVVRSHEKYARNIAFGRGTIVHLWAEDLAAGHEPREITDAWLSANGYPTAARTEALIYRAAMVDFFQTYQPELIVAEYVTIHRTLNGHGYGATPDGLFRIEGQIAGVDWKTRGEGSSHAAYPEEAAQIACGARAEYMVVNGGDSAVRRRLPSVDVGYVVSIKPDGARLYPIDIDKAWTHFCHLHEWWTHRLDEKASIGRVLPKRSAPKADKSTLDYDALMHRYKKLAAQDPVFEERWAELDIPKGDLAAVNAALTIFERPKPLAETVATVRSADPPKPAPVVDDEGGPADEGDINTCKARFEVGMTSEQKAWVGAVVKQAIDAGSDFRVTVKATQRRADIYSALTKFVTSDYWDDAPGFDDMVRALLYGATGSEMTLMPGTDLGNAIGSLRTDEAHTLRTLVDQLLDERQILVVDEATGSLRLKPAA